MRIQDDKRGRGRSAFTLVEVITALSITTVFISFFYVMFVTNWTALGTGIARADLWEEADQIAETLSSRAREARQVDVSVGPEQRSVVVVGQDGGVIMVAGMNAAGEFYVQEPDGRRNVLSRSLDFAQSTFVKNGKALLVQLAFEEQVLSRPVRVRTSVEIYPRN